jgi:cytochrome c peroxidase
MIKNKALLGGVIAASAALGVTTGVAQSLTEREELGRFLYFDEGLSEPDGQSCASCHDPAFGFADPNKGLPVSAGVVTGLFGGRNSPSSAYAMFAPSFYFDLTEAAYIGGQFWDGRATGDVLGDPLADQAVGPFLNPVEMANPDKETVLRDVLASDYADLFTSICGPVDLNDPVSVAAAYDCVGLSIAAFERTALFGQFSSKYDAYLASCIDLGGAPDACAKGVGPIAEQAGAIFSQKEWRGLELFMNDARCSACHVVDWTPASDYALPVQVPAWAPAGMVPPLFADFTYDNLGIPKSEHRLLVDNPVDLGLGAVVGELEQNGKFKVMTLRNIQQTAPYGHNGYFKKLEDIVHFYNTRDVEDWPPPEVLENLNTEELGNLGLSSADEGALVKFMKTLSDGFMMP